MPEEILMGRLMSFPTAELGTYCVRTRRDSEPLCSCGGLQTEESSTWHEAKECGGVHSGVDD